jgi:hypothetical protein
LAAKTNASACHPFLALVFVAMAEPAPDSPRRFIGATLHDGRYAVSGVLGEGSQGTTLEAIDKRDGTLVAIKRFQVRGARSWKDVELAEREASVLMRLSHELLPTAIAHFEEDGALYLVMERIEGKTLAAAEQLSRSDVIRFLHDADQVLAYLHGQSPPVIHRDVKPSNVIRRPSKEGPASHVLVDFGSVRDSLKPSGGSTVVGTFGYMAPEQFQGRALPQSDVYAVGATALTMLTGREPEDLPHKGLAIDVRAALPGDEAMARVLERLVEPNPDVRPTRILPLLEQLTLDEPPPKHQSRRGRRRDRRRERKREQKRRRNERRPERATNTSPLPGLVIPIVVVALSLARIAVLIALRVIVPTFLTLLSLVFGPGLKRAARAVRQAGVVADRGIHRATQVVVGRPRDEEDGTAGKARIYVDEAPGRVEVREAMTSAQDEVNAALEEVAEEIEALRDRPKKKKHTRGG